VEPLGTDTGVYMEPFGTDPGVYMELFWNRSGLDPKLDLQNSRPNFGSVWIRSGPVPEWSCVNRRHIRSENRTGSISIRLEPVPRKHPKDLKKDPGSKASSSKKSQSIEDAESGNFFNNELVSSTQQLILLTVFISPTGFF